MDGLTGTLGRCSVRRGGVNVLLVFGLLLCGVFTGAWLAYSGLATAAFQEESSRWSTTDPSSDSFVASGLGGADDAKQFANKRFPVVIRKPAGPPRVFTGMSDSDGNPITVSCSTCHSTREPNYENKSSADLNEFHESLKLAHGTISCLSCHNSTDYDALKLADGSRVEFSEVMTLCAQCHGPQMRDYEHGVHGGFNGHWDLTRGAQTKNNCIDCHNPHSPQFPRMQPTFKPDDRFLSKENHESHE